MHEPMFTELIGYATGLVVMQRLESRHSLLKRFLAWRHKQYPATLSAALRRRQNRDLESSLFQSALPELLSEIGELDPGAWQSKTQFLERMAAASGQALHDALLDERKQKDSFTEQLAVTAGQRQGPAQESADFPLMREHIKAVIEKNRCYALKGYHQDTSWTLFRVLNLNPGQNMYLQKACFLSTDELWQINKPLYLFICFLSTCKICS